MSINTLWQRFGRAARGPGEFAFAVMIVEKQYFDDEIERKNEAKEKRRARERRKRLKALTEATAPQKRPAQSDASDRPRPPSSVTPLAGDVHVPPVHGSEDLESSSDEEDEVPNVTGETGGADGRVSELMVQVDPSVADEERRRLYDQRTEQKPKGTEQDKTDRELQPAILDFVNAHNRNIGCRRRVLTLVYSNDKRSKSDNNTIACFIFSRSATDFDHKDCDEDQPLGCSRCAPIPSIVCCDMCNPIAFEGLFGPKSRTTRGLRKSTVKPYDSDQRDYELRQALLQWRDKETVKLHGSAVLHAYGGSFILPIETMKRIVQCAHAGIISTPEEFRREVIAPVEWVDKYVGSILPIVQDVYPLPPAASPPPPVPPTAPQQTQPAARTSTATGSTGSAPPAKKRKAPTCGRCGQVGHISESVTISLYMPPLTYRITSRPQQELSRSTETEPYTNRHCGATYTASARSITTQYLSA